jgi:hypothetical protein
MRTAIKIVVVLILSPLLLIGFFSGWIYSGLRAGVEITSVLAKKLDGKEK